MRSDTLGAQRLCRALASAAIAALASGSLEAQVLVPPIRHVFIITLENKDYADTFGRSTQDPYLSATLRPMGALLTHYYATAHVSLSNYIAMISGQAASTQTEADCPSFNEFQMSGLAADQQAIGDGCIYPASIKTLADQLNAAGYSWKGYMEDMGNDPARESASCGHPSIGQKDLTHVPEAASVAVPNGDQYATRHDPFVYFHSILDSPRCRADVVNLAQLNSDLARAASTPNLVFITPNLCNDGHDGDGSGQPGKGCVSGAAGGLASADQFLRRWVPKILASSAYRRDGLLIVTFDESSYASLAVRADAASGVKTITVTFAGASCCNQQSGPNVTHPTSALLPLSPTLNYQIVLPGVGGDRVGAVLLSRFITPGTVSNVPYNHYALLRSLEDLFGLSHLGYAAQHGLQAFGPDLYTHLAP